MSRLKKHICSISDLPDKDINLIRWLSESQNRIVVSHFIASPGYPTIRQIDAVGEAVDYVLDNLPPARLIAEINEVKDTEEPVVKHAKSINFTLIYGFGTPLSFQRTVQFTFIGKTKAECNQWKKQLLSQLED